VQPPAEARDGRLPFEVRLRPARVSSSFPQRRLHVRLDPLRPDRPRADHRLKEEVALDVVGGAVLAHRLGELEPALDGGLPLIPDRGQRADPRANVGRAPGPTVLRAQQAEGPPVRALETALVEALDGDSEAI